MRSVSKKGFRIHNFFLVGFLILISASLFVLFKPSIALADCIEYNPSGQVVAHHPVLANGTCQAPVGQNTVTNSDTGQVTNSNGGGDPFETFAYWIAEIIYIFTVGLGSGIAWLGATILNIAVKFSLDSAAYNLDFISTGWTMLRDIANMAFIFILVFIAMQVMFQAQTHGTVERLVKVLAVALIINFSFFGTRVVIDAGNLISTQFYNAIAGNSTTQTPDLTASIMSGLQFTQALNEDAFKQVSATVSGGSFTALIAFAFTYIVLGAALFMLAAAFVTAGVKFVIRIVMLWFSIVTAPLALVAWAFQGGHGHSGDSHGHGFGFSTWLKNLINHAFYPAVFLFVLLLITHLMSGLSQEGGFGTITTNGFSSITSDGSGWQGTVGVLAEIIVRLGFVLVMLYFAIKAGDYFEVAYSGAATQIGNTLSFGGLTGYRRGVDFFNNTIGPKRWAGGLDNQLKQGSLAGIGNTALGYRFRQAVTKPLSEVKLKDMESRSEFVKRTEKEQKERKENLEHATQHKSGPQAEAKKQKEFEKNYEGGQQGFDKHMEQLTERLEEQQKESNRLAQENLALSRESFQAMTDAQKANYDERVKAHNKAVDSNKKAVKNTQDIIKALKGMGTRIVEAQDKHHTQEIAIKLMSSKNGVKYAAGKQVFIGKSKEAKLADAAKEAAKGDDDHGDEHAEGGSDAGGGAAAGGTGHPPAGNGHS